MKTINQNLDTPQKEESKQNKSNSQNPLEDNTLKAKTPKETNKQPEEQITSSSGKVFNKKRYQQLSAALGISGTLRLPSDIKDDGSYEYFWASTQYDGSIEKKKALGYQVCTKDGEKEYRHFAGMDGSVRHEHVLMRISREDRELISEIQRDKKAYAELDKITKNLDPETTFENKSRLKGDGELTLAEGLQNKYNNNKIKQV